MIAGIIQWYALRLPFPHSGLKYFLRILKWAGLIGRNFQKKTPSGAIFWCNMQEHIERQIFWYGYYEPNETKWLLPFLKRQTVFYDIGANIGYYSVLAAHSNPHSTVYAFEPSFINAMRLKENIRLNGFENSINIIPFAVGQNAGQATLYQAEIDNRGMTSLSPIENIESSMEVPVICLDDYLFKQQLAVPDIIKMDIEGAEWDALQGMQQLLENHHPMLLVELDDRHLIQNNSSAMAIVEWLKNIGYAAFQINATSKLEPLTISSAPISMAVFIHDRK